MDETPPDQTVKLRSSEAEADSLPVWLDTVTAEKLTDAGTAVLVIVLVIILIRSLTALVRESRS